MVMDAGGPAVAAGAAADPPDPLLGRNVGGKFVLERLLGAGAMGAVYRARQTLLEKVVAIKVMHGELARDPMFAARFHREAKAASRLDHPNSIGILDYGQDQDGLLYIAMEYLDGRDLAHLLVEDWPLQTARTIDLMSQALGAIAVAHDLGITHRDLKPENIMVLRRRTDEGVDIDVVKVCDFGIAKVVDAGDDGSAQPVPGRGKLTTAGLVIGTPAYMSPEQGRGEPIDGRSDLYSMGIILYQLITGQLPFDAPSAIGLVVKHQTELPPPPSSVRPGVDPRLEAVCLRALEKAPSKRYQTAREFRAALRSAPTGDALLTQLPSSDGTASAGLHSLRGAEPEVGSARTELALPVVPTAPTVAAPASGAHLATGATTGAVAIVRADVTQRRRWPVVVGGGALFLVAGVLTWRWQAGAGAQTASARTTDMAVSPVEPVARTSEGPRPGANAEPLASPAHEAPAMASATASAANLTGETASLRRSAAVTGRLGTTSPVVMMQGTAVEKPALPGIPLPPSAVTPPVVTAPLVTAPTVAEPVMIAPQPPATAQPMYDLATATMDVGAPTNVQGGTAVNAMLNRVRGDIRGCYVRVVAALPTPLPGTASLRFDTDDEGHIVSASVVGISRDVGSCVERVVKRETIKVDTGTAGADVPLVFKPK